MLLYGYGSYGHAMEPSFSIRNLSLVDRGWIWATAHIRGGSDKGWGWFLDGRKEKKPNTFTDFIACAEHLVAEGYASKGRIAAYGGSAGMLMGAVANLRPDLWGAIIAAVPFVDVLNTMSDTTLPLTPPEWPEWGNLIEDAAAYDLIELQPYDRVSAQPYRRSWPPAACRTRASPTGSRQVGGVVARNGDRRRPDPAQDQHGGRTRRLLGPLRLPEGDRPGLRVRRLGGGWELEAGMIVRGATAEDAAALAAIYGHHVLHGFGTFEEEPPSPPRWKPPDRHRRSGSPALRRRGGRWQVRGFAYRRAV